MNRLKSNQFSVMGIGEPATLEPVVEGRSEMKTPNQFKISASGFAGGLQLSIIEQWHHILQDNWTTLRFGNMHVVQIEENCSFDVRVHGGSPDPSMVGGAWSASRHKDHPFNWILLD
ncbi:MAG: hypothetical protein WAU17_00570 [Nitrospirales bacterium]